MGTMLLGRSKNSVVPMSNPPKKCRNFLEDPRNTNGIFDKSEQYRIESPLHILKLCVKSNEDT